MNNKLVAEAIDKENRVELKIDLGSDMEAFYLFGESDENLNLLEKGLGVRIVARGDETTIIGSRPQVLCAEKVLKELRLLAKSEIVVTPASINYAISMVQKAAAAALFMLLTAALLAAADFLLVDDVHSYSRVMLQELYADAGNIDTLFLGSSSE